MCNRESTNVLRKGSLFPPPKHSTHYADKLEIVPAESE